MLRSEAFVFVHLKNCDWWRDDPRKYVLSSRNWDVDLLQVAWYHEVESYLSCGIS